MKEAKPPSPARPEEITLAVQRWRIRNLELTQKAALEKVLKEIPEHGLDDVTLRRAIKDAFRDDGNESGEAKLLEILDLETMPEIRQRGLGARATFEILMPSGEGLTVVDLGTAAELLTPTKVEAAFLGTMGRAPQIPKRQYWRKCANAIAAAATKFDTSSEDEETLDLLQSVLAGYLTPVGSGDTSKDRKREYNAFREAIAVRYDGEIYLRVPNWSSHLACSGHRGMTVHECARRLSRVGWTKKSVGFRIDAETSRKINVWQAPPGVDA